MMTLYRGALLQKERAERVGVSRAVTLHNQYRRRIRLYRPAQAERAGRGRAGVIISVCRSALEREPFDDSIHIELMRTLLRGNNATEAKAQYEEVMHRITTT